MDEDVRRGRAERDATTLRSIETAIGSVEHTLQVSEWLRTVPDHQGDAVERRMQELSQEDRNAAWRARGGPDAGHLHHSPTDLLALPYPHRVVLAQRRLQDPLQPARRVRRGPTGATALATRSICATSTEPTRRSPAITSAAVSGRQQR